MSTLTLNLAPRREAPSRGTLRLTRRGRLAFVLLILAIALLGVSVGRVASQAGTASGGPATRAITVEPGETLWEIALGVEPNVDPRETVTRIRDLNGLGTDVLQAGQQLIVPN
jgi:LysM repeat protein